MTFINYAAREINCKIVYYGPGLCGKTTNIQYIYDKTNPNAKGKLISLATETDRTLFFDFLPCFSYPHIKRSSVPMSFLSFGRSDGNRTHFLPD